MRNIEARRLTEHVDVLQPKVTRDAVGGQVVRADQHLDIVAEAVAMNGDTGERMASPQRSRRERSVSFFPAFVLPNF